MYHSRPSRVMDVVRVIAMLIGSKSVINLISATRPALADRFALLAKFSQDSSISQSIDKAKTLSYTYCEKSNMAFGAG